MPDEMGLWCPGCGSASQAEILGWCPCCDWKSDDYYAPNQFDEWVPLRKWRVTVTLEIIVWDGKDGYKGAVKHVTFKAVKAHSEYHAQERALDRFWRTHGVSPNCFDCKARVVPL